MAPVFFAGDKPLAGNDEEVGEDALALVESVSREYQDMEGIIMK